MLGDWIHYPVTLLLLLANLVSWAGNFYRLHGNWVIVANTLLVMRLIPATESGLGIGWFAFGLITTLAILGDSFNYASKRHRIFSNQSSEPIRQRVLVGAGIGSLTGVVAGMTIPVIGPLLAVLGAVGGAAGGAWLGTAISPRPTVTVPTEQPQNHATPLLSRFFTDEQIRLIPRLITGVIMVIVAMYSSLF